MCLLCTVTRRISDFYPSHGHAGLEVCQADTTQTTEQMRARKIELIGIGAPVGRRGPFRSLPLRRIFVLRDPAGGGRPICGM